MRPPPILSATACQLRPWDLKQLFICSWSSSLQEALLSAAAAAATAAAAAEAVAFCPAEEELPVSAGELLPPEY